MEHNIRYSQCWEDPELVISGLDLNKEDEVLSIASGGENILAIALQFPQKIVAIDSNIHQIYLLKLKCTAISDFSYEEFVEFIGFKESSRRIYLYNILKPKLSKEEITFWDKNTSSIKKGIVHMGKFENYLSLFRQTILKIALSKNNIKEYLSLKSIQEQKKFYNLKWNTWRWRFLFRIFFSKHIMSKFGRDKKYFHHNKREDIASHFLNRTKSGITEILIQRNYFLHYILTGKIPLNFNQHPYLDTNNFTKLKKGINKIEFIHSDLSSYLERVSDSSFSKFNLSDIFELLTQEEYEKMLTQIAAKSKRKGKIVYWNNLVERNHHRILAWKTNQNKSNTLFKKDRVFFYSRFIVEDLIK